MDLHTMIWRANAQLARRQAALKDTTDHLTLVEELEREQPGAYTHTLHQLRAKRDRQTNSLRATEGFIKSLNAAFKKPVK